MALNKHGQQQALIHSSTILYISSTIDHHAKSLKKTSTKSCVTHHCSHSINHQPLGHGFPSQVAAPAGRLLVVLLPQVWDVNRLSARIFQRIFRIICRIYNVLLSLLVLLLLLLLLLFILYIYICVCFSMTMLNGS